MEKKYICILEFELEIKGIQQNKKSNSNQKILEYRRIFLNGYKHTPVYCQET